MPEDEDAGGVDGQAQLGAGDDGPAVGDLDHDLAAPRGRAVQVAHVAQLLHDVGPDAQRAVGRPAEVLRADGPA